MEVMGILNVTPDSFSDGGRFGSVEQAVAEALAMLEAGADIIDVGGESTRPGAQEISKEEETARVAPVIERLRARTDKPISIDTMKPEVAHAALCAGATIWNDVNALRAPGALELAASHGCGVVLMHMQGEPRTMQRNPVYSDVIAEVGQFLSARIAAAESAGIASDKIWIDPGIGFGKTLDHNLALMRAVPLLRSVTGKPVVIGASRKSFIGRIEERAERPASAAEARVGGSVAAAIWAAQGGAAMVRVHDVAETVQALQVWSALRAAQ